MRAQILHLFCEGQSIRAIMRLTGVSKNTVAKLLVQAGKACMAYHDTTVRNLEAKRIQVDEIWSFVYAKLCQCFCARLHKFKLTHYPGAADQDKAPAWVLLLNSGMFLGTQR